MATKIVTNVDQVMRTVRSIPKQARFASVKALNETGFVARRELQAEMGRVFDRPTPWMLNSVQVDVATRDKPVVTISFAYRGGKGVDPNDVLRAEIFGGVRRTKRFEVALQRAGLLLPGMAAVPAKACPLDAYGNVPGPFIVQLLSYLQAFGEQGYRANMTDRNRAKLSGRGKWINGRFVAAGTKAYAKGKGPLAYRQGGVEYFVSFGRGERNGRMQHLPRGIWQRSGLRGAVVKPVFLFVNVPAYKVRFDPATVIERTVAREYGPRFAASFVQALETAR
jgi:hypothetical protein